MKKGRDLDGRLCVVTGAAGFIGSHLTEALLDRGARVRAVDAMRDYYSREIKESNIASFIENDRLEWHEADLAECDFAPLLEDAEFVFHLAAQAGVRASWGRDFSIYLRDNIYATQRILEALKSRDGVRLVFASSSSVYGDAERFPTMEEAALAPVSPYGLTKASCEGLLRIYRRSHGIDFRALRYFTVYGPRQRPDMAFNMLIKAAAADGTFTLFGDGKQTRDVTYVTDAVEATILAALSDSASGEMINVGGGDRVELNRIIARIEEVMGRRIRIERTGRQKGDARHTGAGTEKAGRLLGYEPKVNWMEGVRLQVEWQTSGGGIPG